MANAAGTWSLINKTGGVADSDLVPSGDTKSAVFTGHGVGTAVIHVTSGSLTSTDSGTLTVFVISVSKLSVSGYVSPATAGVAGNFTVTAQDASGNTVTGYTGTIHFTSSDAQAVLPTNYTFVSGDNGTHTFSATLKTTGSQSITATDTVTNTITGTQSGITVSPAAASQIRVETAANGSGNVVSAQNVTAGNSVTVYAITRDPYGNFVANAAGTWSLINKTGGVADSDLVPSGDTKSAVFTGHGVGTAVIHVTSGSLTSTDSGTLTVFVISVSKLSVSGYVSPATAGVAGNFTVTAQDASGNTVTGYTGTIHFTSSDAQAVLPTNYTFVSGDNGTHTFSATLKTTGSQSITATDTVTNTITGTQSGITVSPAAASQIRVETAANGSGNVVSAQNVTAGNSVTVYAITRDPYGNFVANAAGTWSLINKTGGVADSDLVPSGDTKSAVFTGHGVGTAVIHVTSGSLTSTDSGTLTVFVISVSKLSVSGYVSPATAGVAGNFTVTAQDASGNTVTGYTGTIHFTSSDAQAVLPTNYTFVSGDNGTHTFSATLKTTGSQSITATDTVTNTITGTQSGITVSPAAASQIRVETAANGSGNVVSAQNVTAGNSVTVYAITRDPYGNFVANAAGTWSLINKTGGVADSDLVPSGDTKSAVFTGHGVGTAVIHVTSGSLTSTDSGTLTVFVISVSKLSVSGYVSPATAGVAGNFTVTAQDASGNTVTGYTGTIHFTSSDAQAVLPTNYTFVSGDNGTHTFSATLKTTGSQSITATDTVTNTITGTQSGITVSPAAASQIRVETAANGSGNVVSAQNVTAGNSVTVYAITRDPYGNFVANAAGTWSLINKTGGVADSDLVPSGDTKSAVFTGHLTGTTAIHILSTGLTSTDSGMLTVIAPPSGGGGGGGGGPSRSTTAAGVITVTSFVNAQGIFSQAQDAWSDDGNVILAISAGTASLTSSGAPLTQISIIHMTTPPRFQTGAAMVTIAYDFQPSGATFNPPLNVRFSYNPTLIPAGVAETSLQIASYDSTENAWNTLPSTVDTTTHFIYAQIAHFTPYAVTYGLKVVTQVSTTTTTTAVMPIPTTTTALTTTTPTTTTVLIATTTTPAVLTPAAVSTTPTLSTTTETTTTTPIHSWWLWTIIGVVAIVLILGIIIRLGRGRVYR